jgi:hypothetical protein
MFRNCSVLAQTERARPGQGISAFSVVINGFSDAEGDAHD